MPATTVSHPAKLQFLYLKLMALALTALTPEAQAMKYK
jgi:hypothetical protein